MRLCLKDNFPKVEWLGQSPLLFFSFDRYCQIVIYPKSNIRESLFPHSLLERECAINILHNSNEFLLLFIFLETLYFLLCEPSVYIICPFFYWVFPFLVTSLKPFNILENLALSLLYELKFFPSLPFVF